MDIRIRGTFFVQVFKGFNICDFIWILNFSWDLPKPCLKNKVISWQMFFLE